MVEVLVLYYSKTGAVKELASYRVSKKKLNG